MHGFPSLGASRIASHRSAICTAHWHLLTLFCHDKATCFFRIWIVLDMSCKMSPSAFQPFSPSRISVSGECIQPGVWSWVVELTHVAINLHKLNTPYSALQCLTVPYSPYSPYSTHRMACWIRSEQINCYEMRKSSRSISLHQDRRFWREATAIVKVNYAPLSARQPWRRITRGISALGFDSSPT